MGGCYLAIVHQLLTSSDAALVDPHTVQYKELIASYFGLYVVSLGGHHHGGDLINPFFIHLYFIPHPYNTVLVLDLLDISS